METVQEAAALAERGCWQRGPSNHRGGVVMMVRARVSLASAPGLLEPPTRQKRTLVFRTDTEMSRPAQL